VTIAPVIHHIVFHYGPASTQALRCSICGFGGKSESGLRLHQISRHKTVTVNEELAEAPPPL